MDADITELIGKTFDKVYTHAEGEQMWFENETDRYVFHHDQDCCETVSIEDIIGDLSDLVGQPILKAEERTSSDFNEWPDGVKKPEDAGDLESFTWTFYEFATNKGSVTVRWLGTSNGYYSERVSFERCEHVGGQP